ncbi:MAG: PLuB system PQQ-binding repeat protein [Myxococcota bacterium]
MNTLYTASCRIVLALALAAAGLSVGCDKSSDEKTKTPTPSPPEEPPVVMLEPERHVDLLAPSGDPEALELGESRKFPECHKIFEPSGEVVERFPATDALERANILAGCDPEAYSRAGGRTFIAYRVPLEEAGYHQRFAAFDAEGALAWEYLVDRSENAKNFRANFRSGYIAPLLPRLACAGTLWEGGTRLTCLDAETGESKFDGLLKFWAGLAPRPHETSLVTATLSGITRRYPYSGVEMRFKKFPESGGRSAFYSSDGQSLLFVPADTKYPRMTAYRFDDFKKEWITELPAQPKSHYDDTAVPEHNLVLAKADGKLFAIDTETGDGLWSANVGDDTPPFAADDEALYMLVRRDTRDNLLYSLKPRTAEVNWWSEVPAGTLELRMYDGLLFTRSVRAVQHIPTNGSTPEATED